MSQIIISNKKIEEKVDSVEQITKEFEAIEIALSEKTEEIKILQEKEKELNVVLEPLRDSIAKKELEIEKLKNRDFVLNTELSKKFNELETEKEEFIKYKSAEEDKIQRGLSELKAIKEDLDARSEKIQSDTKFIESEKIKIKETEIKLDTLYNQLEELKQRVIKTGLKKGLEDIK